MDAYRVALQALLDATVALNFTEHNYSLIIIIYIKYNSQPITRSWFIAKTIFSIIAYLTLTFDLMTLTLGQLFCLMNINVIPGDHESLVMGQSSITPKVDEEC